LFIKIPGVASSRWRLQSGKVLVLGIVLLAIFLVGLIWTVTFSLIENEKRQAIEETIVESRNVASIVAANLNEVLGRALLYAKLSTSFLEKQQASPPLLNPFSMGDAAYLRFAIFGAEGQLAYSSSRHEMEPELLRFAQNALIADQVTKRRDLVIIGGHDSHTGWRIPVAVPLVSGQRKIGMFAAYIDLGYFLALYKEASLGTKSRLEILDANAYQLAELNGGTLSAIKDLAPVPYASVVSSGPASGRIDLFQPGSQGEDVGVYRRLDRFPLIVVVTREHDAVLGELGERHQTYYLHALLMSFSCIFLSTVLAMLAHRQRLLYLKLTQSECQKNDLIEQLEGEKKRAFQLASHDFLTGLPNRMKFYELATVALARAWRSRKLSALFFLDLDKFKAVNDTLGHGVGDLLLSAVAERLRLSLREYDIIARMGGDEFVVFISDLDSEESIASIASKLVTSIATPYNNLDGHDIDISPSIGIALYPGDAQNIDALLLCADAAMYQAKAAGRGRYCFYESTLNASSARSSEMIAHFQHAIREGEFCLHYQMRISAADFQPVGLEALVRWQHPKHGLIYPGEFIGLAEEHGFILALGHWVIDAACAQLAKWENEGCTLLPVSINISAKQLSDATLVDCMARSLQVHAVPARLIEIEVTESCLLEQPEVAQQILEKLHQLGIQIALDDYGTGFSGLSHFRKLPISSVKIDRSLIRDIRNDMSDAIIVASTISLTHTLGLKVVAVGVETKEQVVHLKTAGCDELQGFYFHRPAAAEEITPALQATIAYPN
jgi:diguanylate cyclase (GGDEF)-like protein